MAAKYEPGFGWCQHFRCKQCAGWTEDDSAERSMCFASETGEDMLDAARDHEETPEEAGRMV